MYLKYESKSTLKASELPLLVAYNSIGSLLLMH